jgi:hypothetical protein
VVAPDDQEFRCPCGQVLAERLGDGLWEIRKRGRRVQFAGALLLVECDKCKRRIYPETRARRPRAFTRPTGR